jgi:hypothetical protein
MEIKLIREPRFDKAFYKIKADEALNIYLNGGINRRSGHRDVIAGVCELAYQKGYRDGRQEAKKVNQ